MGSDGNDKPRGEGVKNMDYKPKKAKPMAKPVPKPGASPKKKPKMK